VKEWDYVKNEKGPDGYTKGSNVKVWWICTKCKEGWPAWIPNRAAKNSGRPYCSGHRLSDKNRLSTRNPELAKEWDHKKNEKRPSEVSIKNGKYAWWICKKCKHSWRSIISSRGNGTGCPKCAPAKIGEIKRRPTDRNRLSTCEPELIKQWDYKKNKKSPDEYTRSSNYEKVWWVCEKHGSYATTPAKKVIGRGCPDCKKDKLKEISGRPTDRNRLSTCEPELIKQWDYKKNKKSPDEYRRLSEKIVYWICEKHGSFPQSIAKRVGYGQGCPKCKRPGSKAQIRIYLELKTIFKNAINNYRDNIEIDIFLPTLNFGIEYDGYWWHKDTRKKDIKKNNFFKEKGIEILRVREKPLKMINRNLDVLVPRNRELSKTNLYKILRKILMNAAISVDDSLKIADYMGRKTFVNEKEYKKQILNR